MERDDDIEPALERPPPRPRPIGGGAADTGASAADADALLSTLFSDSQMVTLRGIQTTLRAHEIEASLCEIMHALLDALGSRPALCRGLVAAYLLGA